MLYYTVSHSRIREEVNTKFQQDVLSVKYNKNGLSAIKH